MPLCLVYREVGVGFSATVRDDGDVEGRTAGQVCCHITGVDKITSTVSHHLHELEGAGLVRLEKRGKTTLCTLRPEELLALSHRLAKLAEGTDACCCCCEC